MQHAKSTRCMGAARVRKRAAQRIRYWPLKVEVRLVTELTLRASPPDFLSPRTWRTAKMPMATCHRRTARPGERRRQIKWMKETTIMPMSRKKTYLESAAKPENAPCDDSSCGAFLHCSKSSLKAWLVGSIAQAFVKCCRASLFLP